MKAKVIRMDNHWEIHLYNALDELIDRVYVTDLKMVNEKEECHV